MPPATRARVLRFQRRNRLLLYLAAVLLVIGANRCAAWLKPAPAPKFGTPSRVVINYPS